MPAGHAHEAVAAWLEITAFCQKLSAPPVYRRLISDAFRASFRQILRLLPLVSSDA